MNDFQSKRLYNYIKITGRNCYESRENFSRTFKEKVAAIKCQKNSKIKMLRDLNSRTAEREEKSI